MAERNPQVPGTAGLGVEERSGGGMQEPVRRTRRSPEPPESDGGVAPGGDARSAADTPPEGVTRPGAAPRQPPPPVRHYQNRAPGGQNPGPGGSDGSDDDRATLGLFDRPFLNPLTDTIDLSGLRRRLALEDLDEQARVDFGPRLYGHARGEQGDADSTQVLRRPGPLSRPPQDLGAPTYPVEAPWRRSREPGTAARRPADDEFEPGYDEDDYGLRDLDAEKRAGRHRGLGSISSGRSKALWTLFDQVISSGTNTLIGVVVARSVGKTEFGAFSVAFTLFALFIGFSRASATSALGIRYSDASPRLFRSAAAAATGTGLIMGVVTGFGVVVAGSMIGGVVGESLVAIGILFPGLLLQDAWRYVFFAQGRPSAAAANDLLWAVVQLGAVFILITRDVASSSAMLLAWGGAAAVAAFLGIAQSGFWPAPERTREWLSEHREISGYLGLEFITVQGMQQASTLLIGVLAAIEVVGALRGVQILLGPTTVLAVGVVSFAIPEFSRRKDMSSRTRLRAAKLLSIVVVGAGVTWGLLFIALPSSVGPRFLGDTWDGAQDILALTIVQQAGAAATIGPACMLYALGRAKLTFRTNLCLSPQLVIWPIIGLQIWGARGAVLGYIVAFWSAVPVWFLILRRAVREHAENNQHDDAHLEDGGMHAGSRRSDMNTGRMSRVAANESDQPSAHRRRAGFRRPRPG